MGDRGRSCEEHAVCGSVLEEDMVVRHLCITGFSQKIMFWPYYINGNIGGCISYDQWPDRRGSACALVPK
jgi:hypothetical protein